MNIQLDIKNCYGIRDLDCVLKFDKNNVAMIYAPNGVMKTSLASLFESIKNGEKPTDRIFKDCQSSYTIQYRDTTFSYNADAEVVSSDKVYVVTSIDDKIEFNNDSLTTLLADEETRQEYNQVISEYQKDVDDFLTGIWRKATLTKNETKAALFGDLGLAADAEWHAVFQKLKSFRDDLENYPSIDFPEGMTYKVLFNDKILSSLSTPEFRSCLSVYIERLEEQFNNSKVLNAKFTDKNLEDLGKSIEKNNLFNADHHILMQDGEEVDSYEKLSGIVNKQIQEIYGDKELGKMLTKLKKLLASTDAGESLRKQLVEHKYFIPLLNDIPKLKIQFWLYASNSLSRSFDDYYEKVISHSGALEELYKKASETRDMWTHVIEEYNRRFRVPFSLRIDNQATVLLKGEAPNIVFSYTRGKTISETRELKQEDLIGALSRGEKHALYLLHTIFDIECIKNRVRVSGEHVLIVADDVADSFDYKNKYAIVEYLSDLSKEDNIDLLILTHNYDFFRTVRHTLGVYRHACYLSCKDEEGNISISEMTYQKDYFKNRILQCINNLSTDDNKKFFIASIPFFRNLFEYTDSETVISSVSDGYNKLTCCMHLKSEPFDTRSIMLSNIHNVIGFKSCVSANEEYLECLFRISDAISAKANQDLPLEDKIILSIGCRLKAELYMFNKFPSDCVKVQGNQTRVWFNNVKNKLDDVACDVIERILMISPESIHLNSFMYEPLIDVSGWELVEMYNDIKQLS